MNVLSILVRAGTQRYPETETRLDAIPPPSQTSGRISSVQTNEALDGDRRLRVSATHRCEGGLPSLRRKGIARRAALA